MVLRLSLAIMKNLHLEVHLEVLVLLLLQEVQLLQQVLILVGQSEYLHLLAE